LPDEDCERGCMRLAGVDDCWAGYVWTRAAMVERSPLPVRVARPTVWLDSAEVKCCEESSWFSSWRWESKVNERSLREQTFVLNLVSAMEVQ
jgi:hypothetical protein